MEKLRDVLIKIIKEQDDEITEFKDKYYKWWLEGIEKNQQLQNKIDELSAELNEIKAIDIESISTEEYTLFTALKG